MLLRRFSQTFKICLALMLSVLSSGILQAVPVSAFSLTTPDDKVYVCKYVGTPGVDERLKEGKNPISVSVSTLDGDFPGLNSFFTDKQEKSVAIAWDIKDGIDPPVSMCPAAEVPVDVCPNIEGNQATIPEDMTKDVNGNCVAVQGATDVCPNIDGDQATVPENMTKDNAGNCVPSAVTLVTACPAVIPTIHSTNQAVNGWTVPADAEYVEGGIKLNVSGNWDVSYITRVLDGPLADVGTVVDFEALPEQYVGIHIVTNNGTLVYEKEGSYAGKWWSTSDFGVASGMGYATFDTLENIVAANPDVMTSLVHVLYTSPTASSTVITSVTVGCTTYTFDKEGEVLGENDEKITICHATSSAMNPYNKITISVNAADGISGNNSGNGDHYNEHTGPIFNPALHQSGDEWGDIIPPLAGVHNGLNWTAQGQAIYSNGDCEYVAPVDLCPTVPGVQGDTTLCPTPGRVLGEQTGGGQGGGKVLGAAAQAALPAMLPATGAKDSPFMIIAAAMIAYGAAYFLQGRRSVLRNQA